MPFNPMQFMSPQQLGIPQLQYPMQPPIQYPQQQPQTYPYDPGPGPDLVRGISEFLVNYKASSRATKQAAQERAMQSLEMIKLGIPVNQKKVLKDMKTAGWNIDVEAPLPSQVQWEKQKMSQEEMAKKASMQSLMMPQPPQMGPGGQAAGMMAAPGRAMAPTPAGAMPPQPSLGPRPERPQPSMMSRFGQTFGIGRPEPSTESPAGQWLQQLWKKGQETIKDEEQTRQLIKQTRQIYEGVIKGDQKAIEKAYMLGLGQLLPNEGFFKLADEAGVSRSSAAKAMLGVTLGEPQFRAQKMSLAKDMAPFFDNDMGAALSYVESLTSGEVPKLKPGMSFDQAVKIKEMANKLQELRPTLPHNLAQLEAHALNVNPQSPFGQQLSGVINQFPSKGSLDLMKTIGQWNLDMKQMAQSWAIHRENWELGVMQAARTAQNQAFDNWWKVFSDKEATDEQKEAAAKGLANALSGVALPLPNGAKLPGNSVTVDRIKHWYDFFPWSSPDLVIKPTPPDKSQIPSLGGKPSDTSGTINRFIEMIGGTAGMAKDEVVAYKDWFTTSVWPRLMKDIGLKGSIYKALSPQGEQ